MAKTQKPITDEIATVENDIYQDFIGKIRLNPDKILRSESRGKGIELYEDLLRDDQVSSNLQTRKLAVVGKEWEVLPASEKRADQKVADYVEEVLENCNYDDARQTLLSGIVLGFKPAEIMWEYSEGNVWIKEIIGKAARRFIFDLQRNLRLLTIRNMVEGEELPERKFIVYTRTSDDGSPYGDGLGRVLYWPVWFKKNAIKFWMVFADKFGSPTAVGKYPPGTPQPQQDDLLAAIDAIQQESAIKIPNNVEIELLEATRGGSINTYDGLCNFMNAAISKVILGQTLTTEMSSKGGSYAASKTHEDVRQDYIKADADSLSQALNSQLVRWIVDYNFPPGTAYPKVWIRTEIENDLEPLAKRDKIIIVDMGVPVTKDYVYETYGIPKPMEGEELIEAPKPANPFDAAPPPGPENKPPMKKSAAFAEKTDWVATYMERLGPALSSVRKTALSGIEDWLKSLVSPPTQTEFVSKAKEILGTSYAGLDAKAITETVSDMYLGYRKAPGMNIGFGGPDVRSINFLADLDRFYVSSYIKNPDAEKAVTDFLSERYLSQGEGLFGRGSAEGMNAFRDLFTQKLADLEDWQVRRIVDTSVTRTQNWGRTAQYEEAGITEMQIHEPTKDCAFCAAMDGQVIDVSSAYALMMEQTAMKPGEFEADMKAVPPVQGNEAAMAGAGRLPPYHPHCRGIVIRRVK